MIRPDVTALYKYRAFNEQSLSILINKKVWFASPDSFNDPFDCGSEISYQKHVAKRLMEKNITPTHEGIKQAIKTYKEKSNLKKVLDGAGVFSMSEINDDILMWSHYADSHKGFCIGFERNSGNPLGDDKRTHPINYVNDVALIDYSEPRKLVEEFYLNKSKKHWEYEKEWRCILYPSDPQKNVSNIEVEIPGAIESITFGLNMPEEHRRTIINILGDEVDYYRVEKNKKNFKLDVSLLSKEEIAVLQKG